MEASRQSKTRVGCKGKNPCDEHVKWPAEGATQFRAVSSPFPDPKQLPAPVVAGSQLPFPKPRRLPDPGVGGIQKFKKVVLGAGGWGQCGGGKIPKLDLRIPNFAGAGIDYP